MSAETKTHSRAKKVLQDIKWIPIKGKKLYFEKPRPEFLIDLDGRTAKPDLAAINPETNKTIYFEIVVTNPLKYNWKIDSYRAEDDSYEVYVITLPKRNMSEREIIGEFMLALSDDNDTTCLSLKDYKEAV